MSTLPALLSEVLDVYAGDDTWFPLSLFDDDAQLVPSDLTGLVFTAAWRKGETYVELLVESVDLAEGMLSIYVSPDASYAMVGQSLTALKGKWDIQSVDPDGFTSTRVRGFMRVTPDVTRA